MKLWEVIKALDENPNKRFKHALGSIIGFDDNVLQWLEKDGEIIEPFLVRDRRSGTGICHNTGDNWQLVRQPVTWQEAIQAWAEGKTVIVENTCAKRKYDGKKDYLKDVDGNLMGPSEIRHGTWYVED